tara:strand:- start:3587 stop:4600 length:1014 start_codon:yes stop_codon:yes gene_type:complete
LKIVEDLKDNILKDHSNVCFDLLGWDEILGGALDVTVYHLISTVKYYVSYHEGHEISFLIKENNKPIAAFPCFVHKIEDEWIISSNGSGLIGPLFNGNTPKKLRKRIEKQLIDIIQTIAVRLDIRKVNIFETNSKLSNWYLTWLDKANRDYLTYQMAVDLRKEIEEIRLDFRKSYKPLVNKAFKEWKVQVCDTDDEKVFEEFRLLHLDAAGKQTRSIESWNIQRNQLRDKQAFLVTVRDEDSLIGAGFFNYSRDEGMYSVGAYKRELFDKPIGHAVQMLAIEKLKELGCLRYNLGQKTTALDETYFSEKENSISHFKEGFSGYIYTRPHLEVIFKSS